MYSRSRNPLRTLHSPGMKTRRKESDGSPSQLRFTDVSWLSKVDGNTSFIGGPFMKEASRVL